MAEVIVAIVAVLVVAISGLVFWRRSPKSTDVRRDPPTTSTGPAGLGEGLVRTRRALAGRLVIPAGRHLDDDFWDGLTEGLIAADVGVADANAIVGGVRAAGPTDAGEAAVALRDRLVEVLGERDRSLRTVGSPACMLIVGVNGSGKTTTIAKLAHHFTSMGESVLVGAADTFRAAASDQLRNWAGRIGVDIVSGDDGADPAAVAFDAFGAARARGRGVVIVDTAGRLHSKHNLMEELAKIARVLTREAGALDEVLLVLDGTAGQNGIAQARAFTEAVGVTGIVISKLDGTARGGIAIAVERQLGIPVKLLGVGEAAGDLLAFEPASFVDALLGES